MREKSLPWWVLTEPAKPTLLNIIFSLLRPASGTVEFLGRRIDHLAPHHIGELGISYVPEGGRPFREMTVRENLEMGAYVYKAWKQKRRDAEPGLQYVSKVERKTETARRDTERWANFKWCHRARFNVKAKAVRI